MICESCEIKSAEIVEKCDDEKQPYRLCRECHRRLLSYSLRPIEWYNLASRHTFNNFLLHDDFYEDNGVATQPEEEVENADNLAAPSLDDVKGNIELLLDYCIAKWWLQKDMVDCLKNHDSLRLLQSIKDRFDKTENYFVKARLYEVASTSLGRKCENWIGEQWRVYNGEHLQELSKAAALCLPFDEGYSLVKNALESAPDRELEYTAFSCLYIFRTQLTFEWIYRKAKSPIKFEWGKLAAASNPTWDIIYSWLQEGRPWSLVAIDTLVSLIPHPGELILKRLNPKPILINPASIEVMTQVLKEYSEKDNVPRVKRSIEKILNNWEFILKS